MLNFLVEIKCKQQDFERKFNILAPSKERAEEWGSIQAKQLGLDKEKARISATQIITAEPKPKTPEPEVQAEEKQKRKKKEK